MRSWCVRVCVCRCVGVGMSQCAGRCVRVCAKFGACAYRESNTPHDSRLGAGSPRQQAGERPGSEHSQCGTLRVLVCMVGRRTEVGTRRRRRAPCWSKSSKAPPSGNPEARVPIPEQKEYTCGQHNQGTSMASLLLAFEITSPGQPAQGSSWLAWLARASRSIHC